ncbi:MAG TPA: hypothetical protein DEB39_09295 [Planctomycetaceae bacterium]|nr:hypothetical protein [Planctomycetaceae bacterium]
MLVRLQVGPESVEDVLRPTLCPAYIRLRTKRKTEEETTNEAIKAKNITEKAFVDALRANSKTSSRISYEEMMARFGKYMPKKKRPPAKEKDS